MEKPRKYYAYSFSKACDVVEVSYELFAKMIKQFRDDSGAKEMISLLQDCGLHKARMFVGWMYFFVLLCFVFFVCFAFCVVYFGFCLFLFLFIFCVVVCCLFFALLFTVYFLRCCLLL